MIAIAIPQTMVLSILAKCKDCANVLVRRAGKMQRPNYLCKSTEEKMHPNCENIPTGQSQEMWFLEFWRPRSLHLRQILCKCCSRRGKVTQLILEMYKGLRYLQRKLKIYPNWGNWPKSGFLDKNSEHEDLCMKTTLTQLL